MKISTSPNYRYTCFFEILCQSWRGTYLFVQSSKIVRTHIKKFRQMSLFYCFHIWMYTWVFQTFAHSYSFCKKRLKIKSTNIIHMYIGYIEKIFKSRLLLFEWCYQLWWDFGSYFWHFLITDITNSDYYERIFTNISLYMYVHSFKCTYIYSLLKMSIKLIRIALNTRPPSINAVRECNDSSIKNVCMSTIQIYSFKQI